jgi:glucose/arabinose dehydrogenase
MESKYKNLAMFVAGLTKRHYHVVTLLMCLLVMFFVNIERVGAQPTVVDPRLEVRTVVSGLSSPTTMAFLGENDILVLEKETGRVRRVMNGAIQSTVLDLPVNFGY